MLRILCQYERHTLQCAFLVFWCSPPEGFNTCLLYLTLPSHIFMELRVIIVHFVTFFKMTWAVYRKNQDVFIVLTQG